MSDTLNFYEFASKFAELIQDSQSISNFLRDYLKHFPENKTQKSRNQKIEFNPFDFTATQVYYENESKERAKLLKKHSKKTLESLNFQSKIIKI
jgi:putative alpha-1,2-mannosidase